MKSSLRPALLALSFSLLPGLSFAATAANPPPATAENPATKTAVAGQYAGKWKSSSDAGGDLRIKLKQDGATWTAEASFTLESVEVPTKTKSIQVDGSKLTLTITWEAQGTPGESRMEGELSGDTFKGTYETSGAPGTSKGTWTVRRT